MAGMVAAFYKGTVQVWLAALGDAAAKDELAGLAALVGHVWFAR